MTKKQQTITYRLIILICMPLIIFLVFGAFCYMQVNEMASFSEKMYRHPYAVGQALRDIKLGVLEIDKLCQKKISFESSFSRQEVDKKIAAIDQFNKEKFKILHDRFLGDREKIVSAEDAYMKWVMESEKSSGKNRLADSKYFSSLNDQFSYLRSFADEKGASFYKKVSVRESFDNEINTHFSCSCGISSFLCLLFCRSSVEDLVGSTSIGSRRELIKSLDTKPMNFLEIARLFQKLRTSRRVHYMKRRLHWRNLRQWLKTTFSRPKLQKVFPTICSRQSIPYFARWVAWKPR